MASDFQKPNRTHTLFPEEIPRKMWPLPVTDLFFVGKSLFFPAPRLGISTIGRAGPHGQRTTADSFHVLWGGYLELCQRQRLRPGGKRCPAQ